MANDRIYVVCIGCGSRLLLIKYYPPSPDGRPGLTSYLKSEPGLAAWLLEHHAHNPHYGESHLHTEPGFRFVTEIDEDKHHILDEISNLVPGPETS